MSQASHKIQIKQICAAIRIAAVSSNRFERVSPVSVVDSYDDDTYEFWRFGFPTGIGEKMCIQSCTCIPCGNYLISPIGDLVSKSALCNCDHGFFREPAENEKIKNEKKQRCNEMNKWDGFDAFVKVVLPDGERDRLCEDVVGEIMRFL